MNEKILILKVFILKCQSPTQYPFVICYSDNDFSSLEIAIKSQLNFSIAHEVAGTDFPVAA